MRKIIVDTSFWLLPFERKIDLFGQFDRLLEEPYSIVVPKAVLDELNAMARGRNRRATAARGALRIIEAKLMRKDAARPSLELSLEKGKADGAIVTTALQNGGCIVATNDYALRIRLRAKHVRTMTLMDGNMLGFA